MKKLAYKQMYANELDHAWYRATRQLMLSLFKIYVKADAKILDAGCGTGGTITFLEQNGYKNVLGVDDSRLALFYCKKRGHKVFSASVNKLPFKSNSFDAVICMDVLYHKGVAVDLALAEFRRVLKHGGVLYNQEPAINWLRGSHDVYIETNRRFSKTEILRCLKRIGLTPVKVTYFNIILLPLIMLKRCSERFVSSRSKGSDVSNLFAPINYIMLKVFLFEISLLKKHSFPIGLTIITFSRK